MSFWFSPATFLVLFIPVAATNTWATAMQRTKPVLNLLFSPYKQNQPLHVKQSSNTIINYYVGCHPTPRQTQKTHFNNSYNICKQLLTKKQKILTPQLQFIPWDTDDVILSQYHTIIHLLNLTICKDFHKQTERMNPLLVYHL